MQIDGELLDESDKPLFDILKNISSLGIKIRDLEIEFHNYEILKNIDFQKLPLVLRALVADILWTQKKNFNASQIAAKAYWDLFQSWYKIGKNTEMLDVIKRAVCISMQTNQKDLYKEICAWFDDFVLHDAANREAFFSLNIMELFVGQKGYNVEPFIPVLDSIISLNQDNNFKVEKAYKLKTQCLCKLKKREEDRQNKISLAKYYDIGVKSLSIAP